MNLARFGRRILFRGVFLLLAVATVALALVLLKDEKERSWRDYREGFRKTHAEVLARLRHPAGLLALLNPGMGDAPPGSAKATSRPRIEPLALSERISNGAIHCVVVPRIASVITARCAAAASSDPGSRGTISAAAKLPTR